MFKFIKKLFSRKKIVGPLVGFWGFVDKIGKETVCGEMYSLNGEWIAGLKLSYDPQLINKKNGI